jgi:tRNA(adenine34) deaminase
MTSVDDKWMAAALDLAREAAAAAEVPVGAVIVMNEQIVGRGRNRMMERSDPRAHAEMEAISDARTNAGGARLDGATLYVTLEPCLQCAGAIVLTRIARVVLGAWDARLGACGSRWSILEGNPLGDVRVRAGVCEAECGALLKEWFRTHRENAREN